MIVNRRKQIPAARADRENRGAPDSARVRGAIARAQNGDIEALRCLYAHYANDVLRYVRSLVDDTHEAEDITQDIFVKLMATIRSYEPREVPFAAWILRVARNCAVDHHRGRRMYPCEEVHVSVSDNGPLNAERRRDFSQALNELPDEQRDVLILRHIQGLSPREIAFMLGKTESSVHGLHHRGRHNLRSALEEMGTTPVVAPLRAA